MGAQGYSSSGESNNKDTENQSVRQFGQPSAMANSRNEIEENELNQTVITTQSAAYLPLAGSQVKDYFKSYIPQNLSSRISQTSMNQKVYSTQKFSLQLKIQYKTEIGECLGVVGNIDELGNWKDFSKCVMQWTEGHYWVANNFIVLQPHFLYKYVILQNGKVKRWEGGANRIADLKVLPDLDRDEIKRSPSMSSMKSNRLRYSSPNKSPTRSKIKDVEIVDEWEHFKIRFSIMDPIEEQLLSQGDYMRIIGSTPKLGSSNVGEMESTPPMRMNRSIKPIEWMSDKYGQNIRPWEITISFHMGELELPNEIIYNYSKSDEKGNSIVKEREPSRSMLIQAPETYNGELGKQGSIHFKNQQKVFIVNGIIDKADGNFLGGLFFDKIGDTGIFLGTYPLWEDDVKKMKAAGITGVLNLQTDEDIHQRGIPWDKLKQYYKSHKIKCYRFPLSDSIEDELCANLFVGAQHVYNMINSQKLTLYIHCTSGICRAPALTLVYLCLFKRVKQWQNPQYVQHFVKAFHGNSNPNMRAVLRVVQANQDFQSQQKDINTEISDKNSGSDKIDEFYFPQMGGEQKKQSLSPRRVFQGQKRSSYIKQFVPQTAKRSVTPTPIAYVPKQLIDKNQKEQNELKEENLEQFQQLMMDKTTSQIPQRNQELQEFRQLHKYQSEQPQAQNNDNQPINYGNQEKINHNNIQVGKGLEVNENDNSTSQFNPVDVGAPQALTRRDNSPSFSRPRKQYIPPPQNEQINKLRADMDAKAKRAEKLRNNRREAELRKRNESTSKDPSKSPNTPETPRLSNHQAQVSSTQFNNKQDEVLEIPCNDQQNLQPGPSQSQDESISKGSTQSQRQSRFFELPDVQAKEKEPTKFQEERQVIIRQSNDSIHTVQEAIQKESKLKEVVNFQTQNPIDEFDEYFQEEKLKREHEIKQAEIERRLEEERKEEEHKQRLETQRKMEEEQRQIEEDHQKQIEELERQEKLYILELERQRKQAEESKEEARRMKKQEQENLRKQYEEQMKILIQQEDLMKQEEEEARQQVQLELQRSSIIESERIKKEQELQKQIKKQQQEYEKMRLIEEEELKRQMEIQNLQKQQQQKQEEEQLKRVAMEKRRKDQQETIARMFLTDFLNLEVYDIIYETHSTYRFIEQERLKREQKEAIKRQEDAIRQKELAEYHEMEKLRQEKIQREIAEKARRQRIADEKVEKERMQRMAEEMELEKVRLQQIAEENERKRKQIQQEAEKLKQQEEANKRAERLQQIQLQEEHEAEKKALSKIAQDKEERMKLLQEKVQLAEDLRHKKFIEEKLERQRLVAQAEQENERIRSMKMSSAHNELQRLQNLRKEEELKLKQIKESFEEEERVRLMQFQIQEEIEHQKRIKQREMEEAENAQKIADQLKKEKEIALTTLNETIFDNKIQERIKQEFREIQAQQNQSQVQGIKSDGGYQIKLGEINNSAYISNYDQTELNSINLNHFSSESPQKNIGSKINEVGIYRHSNIVVDNELDHKDIEMKCNELFKEAPIKFIPKKGWKVEELVGKLIKKHNITLPIIHVRQSLYLIGPVKVNLDQKFNSVMIRPVAGGGGCSGQERFDTYVLKNHRKFERQLVKYMNIQNDTLKNVMDSLSRGEKIRKSVTISMQGNTPKRFSNILPASLNAVKKVSLNINTNSPSRSAQVKGVTTPNQYSSIDNKKFLFDERSVDASYKPKPFNSIQNPQSRHSSTWGA